MVRATKAKQTCLRELRLFAKLSTCLKTYVNSFTITYR